MVRPLPIVARLAPALAVVLAAAPPVRAAPALRHQLEVNGDFALVGNTLAHDCGASIPAPVVGTLTACGTRTTDSGVDAPWLSNPAAGAASADVAFTPAQAQSTAVLSLPAGAIVRYARIYWASIVGTNAYDAAVTVVLPDGVTYPVTADDGVTVPVGGRWWYQSTADLTSLVQGLGEPRGGYTLGGADSIDYRSTNNEVVFSAWWMAVFYEVPGDPVTRQLTLFDGVDYVSGADVQVTLSGFLVPVGGWDAKLGVVTFEGDHAFSGDELWFKGYTLPASPPAAAAQTRLSDAQNPATNFFNGTRSWLGSTVSVAGDLPQLTGAPASMSSFDLDVVDLKAAGAIGPGNDAAVIRATTGGDIFGLGGFVTSIATFRPSFVETVKTVAAVPDDGAILAGDTLRYTIVATNTGSDASVNTLVRDTLPVGVSFVPGSVGFSGPNGGADYDAAARTLTARVGTGADATQGGSIAVGGSFTVTFDVTVDAGTSGVIVNSATVSAAGALGDPQTDFPSHDPSGSPGTGAPVDACLTDAQCGGSTPACDTGPTPNVCVACLADAHCSGATPFCDVPTRTCVATTSLSPASQERFTVAGTGVPLPMTLASQLSTPETYDLDVPAGACGWGVEILDGAGALVATRDAGGTWSGRDDNGNGLPDLGATAAGGTTSFQLRLTPPGGAAPGDACTAVLTASGSVPALAAQAAATARVGLPVTYGPDHTGAAAKIVGSGATVNFPGVVQNNGPADASFALSATESTVPAAGPLAAMAFYLDPDGDGVPDGAPVGETGTVGRFGGRVNVVLQVRATTAGGTAVATGTVISVTANAGAAVQLDEATVGYLATFADAGGAVSARAFAPCSTAYVRATKLPPGPEYAVEWYAKASPVRGTDTPVRTVDPWFVMGGAASDALALGAAAAPGPWTILLVQRSGGVDTVLDQLPFTVERAGVFTQLAAPARLVLGAGAPLEVSASVRNDGASAALAATNLSYAVGDGTLWMDGSGAFAADPARRARLTSGVTVAAGATAADAFTVLAPAWPAPGTYHVNAEWQLSCGAVPLVATATATVVLAPPAPVVDTPAAGAVVPTTTPTLGGSARPGASVVITVDAQPLGPVVADAGGRFAYTLAAGEALGQGAHAVTAVQTENAVASDASAPLSFTVDTLPPAVAVTSPSDGALLGGAQAPGGAVTVSGTGEAGAAVSVQIGATTVAATWSGATWSASFGLADGAHTAIATATDGAGNAATASASFTIDTVPPGSPAISAPAPGEAFDASTAAGGVVTVSGTADASATVTVTVGAQTLTAGRAGAAFSATFTLADGAHTASATATDAAGNGSPPASVAFTLDATAPAAPAFGAPAPGQVMNATTAPGGVVTVSGTVEAGATVTLSVDGDVRTLPAPAGAWSDTFTLGEGSHTATATAADPAGNGSAPAALSFSVDTVLPAAATVDPVASPTRADPVHVTGAAEPGATVRLYEGGVLRGEAVAGAGGAFDIVAAVGEGSHTLSAVVVDAAGNEAASAPTVTFTVDRTAPPVPAIVAPADGAVLDAADLVAGRVVFSGTAEPNSAVEVWIDGTLADGATTDASGAWSVAITVADGDHTARARAIDEAGNGSAQGGATAFRVDATLPAAPVLSAPAAAVSTNAATLAVSGTAEPDVTIELLLDGVVVDTVVAGALGLFAHDLVLPATDGARVLTAVAVDGAGNRSPASAPVTVTVDRTAPAAAAIAAPAEGGWVTTGTVVVSGSAEPGATVRITADTGVTVDVTAAADGSFQASLALPDGARSVSVRVLDAAGNGSGDVARAFGVDTVRPAAPTIATPAAGTTTNAASLAVTGAAPADAVLVRILDGAVVVASGAPSGGAYTLAFSPAEGDRVLTAVALDAAGNVSDASAPVAVAVDRTAPAAPGLAAPASPTSAATVTFTGTAEPNATVELVAAGGAVLASGGADATGAFAIGVALAEGSHTVTARATDAAGNTGAGSPSVDVLVDRTAPGLPAVVSPGDAGLLGAADLPGGNVAVSGTAEPLAEVAVEVDGAVTLVLADASGAWSLAVALADGLHGVRAAATDAAGNGSGYGAFVTFTVDTVAPAAPVVASPAAGTLTNAASVTVSGTAEAGATVTVNVGGALLSVVADGTGAFTATLALPAGDGATSISAVAVDAAGNVSPSSAVVAVSVDRTAPAAPVVDAPADGAAFAPGAVEIRGRAEAGASVTVVAAGTSATVTAAADGAWSVTVTFPAGTHPIDVTAVDAAGNASAATHLTVTARADDGAGGGGGCGCGAGAGGASSLLAFLALAGIAPRVRRRRR